MSYRIQYLLSQLQWITATANHDVSKYGEWQCNYQEVVESIQKELNDLIMLYETKKYKRRC